MRILYVTPAYKPYLGGVERVLEQVSQRVVDQPDVDDVAVLTTKYDFNSTPPRYRGGLADCERLEGIVVYRKHFRPQALPGFYHFPAGLFADVGDVVEEFRPDVVHFLFSEWYAANEWIFRQTRSNAHIFTYFYHPYEGLWAAPMRSSIRRLCRSVDYVHVVSEFAARHVSTDAGVPPARIRVTSLGVSRLAPPPSPAEPRDRKDALSILSVGRLSRSKGQLDLVRCFARLVADVERPLRLVLVGGDGGEREAITSFVRNSNLELAVEIAGYVGEDELERYYSEADVFCLLSTVEAYGLVFLEAASHGLPIVAYGLEPVRQVLTAGALLAEPGSWEQAETHLRRLLRDDALRVRLSEEARAVYDAHPTWDDVAAELVSLYREAVLGGASR